MTVHLKNLNQTQYDALGAICEKIRYNERPASPRDVVAIELLPDCDRFVFVVGDMVEVFDRDATRSQFVLSTRDLDVFAKALPEVHVAIAEFVARRQRREQLRAEIEAAKARVEAEIRARYEAEGIDV